MICNEKDVAIYRAIKTFLTEKIEARKDTIIQHAVDKTGANIEDVERVFSEMVNKGIIKKTIKETVYSIPFTPFEEESGIICRMPKSILSKVIRNMLNYNNSSFRVSKEAEFFASIIFSELLSKIVHRAKIYAKLCGRKTIKVEDLQRALDDILNEDIYDEIKDVEEKFIKRTEVIVENSQILDDEFKEEEERD